VVRQLEVRRLLGSAALREEAAMSDEHQARRRQIPWQQVLLDDIFLILLAGLLVPTLFYIVWGLISLGNVPLFGR
jgi:hypothetical protein